MAVANGTVAAAGEKWVFTEPCVTTFELADLADWLDELAANGAESSAFEFTEPNLKFAYVPWPRPARPVARSSLPHAAVVKRSHRTPR